MLSSFHYHFSTGKKEGRQGKLKVIMTATIHYHYHYHCHSLLQTHNNNPMGNTRSQKTTRKRDLFNFLSFHRIFILLHHMFKSMPKVVLPPPISYVTPQGMVTYCHRNFNSSQQHKSFLFLHFLIIFLFNIRLLIFHSKKNLRLLLLNDVSSLIFN